MRVLRDEHHVGDVSLPVRVRWHPANRMDRLRPSAALVVAITLLAAGEAARGGQPRIRNRITTTVHVRHASELARTLRECRGRGPREWRPSTTVVDRRNGKRRSLTFRSADGRSLAACDAIGVRIEGRRWCAPATGTLFGGRLRDPRLTLCQPRGGKPVAFIWVTPGPHTRWIGILRGRRTELYRVAAGLPVRVSTDRNVRIGGSSATFFVRQYDGRWKLLVRQAIVAHVAG